VILETSFKYKKDTYRQQGFLGDISPRKESFKVYTHLIGPRHRIWLTRRAFKIP